jgi:hypothetical protein
LDLFLAISQGTGHALATGVRPFLPPLVAGALARADAGLDFSGSDYAFLESAPFLAAMVGVAAVGVATERLGLTRVFGVLLLVVAVGVGAFEFAGSLAGEGHRSEAGLAAGAVCALLAYLAAASFFGRAHARLAARNEGGSASYLSLYAEIAALCLAALAILVPPISYLALAFCAWVLIERRRRAARKYEGLRVLR